MAVRLVRPGLAALAMAFVATGAWGADATIVSRSDPEFPREALQAGVDKGRVKARMTLSGSGEVMRVEVLEANPRRVFDRAVVKTLASWRYNTGAENRQVEVEIDFHR